MPVRILLADDHHIVRQGFRALLEKQKDEFTVVAEASTGEEALQLAKALNPDVAVLDLTMPGLNGVDAAAAIIRECSGTRAILLSMHTAEHLVVAALRAGVRGYVVKTQAAEDLIRAIRDVLRGEIHLSSRICRAVVDAYLAGAGPPTDPLAPRERHVLQLVAEGKTSKEIATRLGLTTKTAESYRARIMEKLDIHDTAGLVRYAIREGLVQA